MTLFLFDWADRVSLVIEHDTEQLAGVVALEVADNVQPTKVRRLPPGLLVAELYAEEPKTKGAPDTIVLEALPHVLDVLGDLLEDDPAASPHLRVVPPPLTCPSEADDAAGNPVRCVGRAGHTGVHHCGDLVWGRA